MQSSENLNISPEAYWCHLEEVAFNPDVHSRLIAQKSRVARLKWLYLAVQTAQSSGGSRLGGTLYVNSPDQAPKLGYVPSARHLGGAHGTAPPPPPPRS